MQYNTYVGVYIECIPTDITIESKITVLNCNKNHIKNGWAGQLKPNFCDICGGKYFDDIFIQRIITSKQSCDDIVYATDDMLFVADLNTTKSHIYLPNKQFHNRIDTFGFENCLVQINQNIINNETAVFKSEYNNVIQMLINEYGENNVNINYGIVCYYN